MLFLHVADSANHLGAFGLASVFAASLGVAAGTFVVFGLPPIFRRHQKRDADRPEDEARGEVGSLDDRGNTS